ncbi:TPA: hypothetical protein EYO77_06290, partial [Candidatus Poribacteria bacterium]|nr:hypothetical protein [Candidatus Poribacteria bacterium]
AYRTSGQFTVMLSIIIRYIIICVIHYRDYPIFCIQKFPNHSGEHNFGRLPGVRFGRTPATGSLTFMFAQSSIRRPVVGDIYLFPNWLEHMVYPFEGKGERRSVAFNVNF